MSGFNEEELLQLRLGKASFDTRLNALAARAKNTTEKRGNTDEAVLENYFNAGWTKENLIDIISLVGDKTISNYIHNTTKTPVHFPAAPKL